MMFLVAICKVVQRYTSLTGKEGNIGFKEILWLCHYVEAMLTFAFSCNIS